MLGSCIWSRDILVVSISTCTHICSKFACTHAMYKPIHYFMREQSNTHCAQYCQFVHLHIDENGILGLTFSLAFSTYNVLTFQKEWTKQVMPNTEFEM